MVNLAGWVVVVEALMVMVVEKLMVAIESSIGSIRAVGCLDSIMGFIFSFLGLNRYSDSGCIGDFVGKKKVELHYP